ncbi:MAG: hypothetical protein RL363_1421, partial [Bacteroidota bacterium]
QKEKDLRTEEARLIQKMLDSKNGGAKTQRPPFTKATLYDCETLEGDFSANQIGTK